MPTANERRALWFLAAVALSGSVVRLARSRAQDPAADPAFQRQIGRVDSVRERRVRSSARDAKRAIPHPARSTPRAGSVDLNSASAAELDELPGIGPALATHILAARDSLHGFRDLAGLCGVRGVGPALVERLRPLVTLSGERLAEGARCPQSRRAAQKSRASREPESR